MTFLRSFLTFQGRLRRRDWWWMNIALLTAQTILIELVVIILFGLDASVFGSSGWLAERPVFSGPGWVGTIVYLIGLWPVVAMTARRAHDQDSTGHGLVAIQALNVPFLFMSEDFYDRAYEGAVSYSGDLWATAAVVIILGLLAYATVVLAFVGGTPGPNLYGPSPKDGPGVDLAEVFD